MFILTIKTEGAAFDGDPSMECAEIMREAIRKMEAFGFTPDPVPLRDSNGNRVGSYAHGPAAHRILADMSGSNARPLLMALRERLHEIDREIDDDANDGRNARPPEGDDYNTVWNDAMDTLNRILEG